MGHSFYNKNLKNFAREHRNFGTKGEAILWKYILSKRKTGYQFNRQFIIENYIVDFVSRKLNLVIEIDGSSHYGKEKSEYDKKRENRIKELGFIVLRFEERDVIASLNEVSRKIFDTIKSIEEGYKG